MKQQTPTQLRETAYHEAGHAVMYWLAGLPFVKISIVPNWKENEAGSVMSAWYLHLGENPPLPEESCKNCGCPIPVAAIVSATIHDHDIRSNADHAINNICALSAAAEADYLLTGRYRDGDGFDRNEIDLIADHCWPYHAEEERQALLQGLRAHARATLRKYWSLVTALAEELIKVKEMSEKEAVAILLAAMSERDRGAVGGPPESTI